MFSKLNRRTHMYAALFLTPWVLMYALSTIVMNHREQFKEHYGGALVKWEKEKEQPYAGKFTPDSNPRFMGEQIMRDLQFDGNFNVNMSKNRQKLTIVRTHPVTPRRITYSLTEGNLLVEKQELRTQPFLESLHRRRGFQSMFLLDNLWGAVVDAVIVAMVIWALSGLWMWWELKLTRLTGAVFLSSGLVLFTVFLFML